MLIAFLINGCLCFFVFFVRRVRDYGFLHANAKRLLALVQLILHVFLKEVLPRKRPVFKCPKCQSPMVIKGIRRPLRSG